MNIDVILRFQNFEKMSTKEKGKICLDLKRIQQVILNLISNSLKFTPNGGSILV